MTPSRIIKSLPRNERGWNLPLNSRYSWGLSEQSCSVAEVDGVSCSVWRFSLFGFIPPSVIANGASSLPVSSMPLAGQWVSIETSEGPNSRRGAPMIHPFRIYGIFEENKEQAGSREQRGCDCCSRARAVLAPRGGGCSASARLGALPEILSAQWICRGRSTTSIPAMSADWNPDDGAV